MDAFLIAALHAVPVFAVGKLTRSLSALNWTAAIVGVVAIASGKPAFLIGDLVAIGIAYVLMLDCIDGQKKKPGSAAATVSAAAVSAGTELPRTAYASQTTPARQEPTLPRQQQRVGEAVNQLPNATSTASAAERSSRVLAVTTEEEWKAVDDGDWGGPLRREQFREAQAIARKLSRTVKTTTRVVRENQRYPASWVVQIPKNKDINPEVVRAACHVVDRELHPDELEDQWAILLDDPEAARREEIYRLDEVARYKDIKDPFG